MRKRLLALAYLAQGLGVDDAAIRVGMSADNVRRYRQRFQQGGMAALHSKPFRGGMPKLKPRELQVVANRMKQGTDSSLGALGTWIREEFGVCYTPKGLKNMLKKQFGFQNLPP